MRSLPLAAAARPVDFLWASPPCTEFSNADPRVDHASKRPSIELVCATLAVVRMLRPRFWIMENVRGAIPFLGIPAQKIGPWCLWGYFPEVKPSFRAQTYEKWTAGRSVVARAAVPVELADAVYQAVARANSAAVVSLLDMRPFRRHRHHAARNGPSIDGSPDLFEPGPFGAAPSLDTTT